MTISWYERALHAVLRRPALDRVGVERDERGDEVAVGAVDDELAGVGAQALERRLDDRRRDVLAAARLEQVLLAVGDPQEAPVVDLADVPGVQPALGVERLGGRVGVVVVALHDSGTTQQHLAVLGDADLGARQRPADRAVAVGLGAVDEGCRARLGEPVALGDLHAHGVEPARDVLVQRRRAGDEEADPSTEAVADLGADRACRRWRTCGPASPTGSCPARAAR